MTQPHFHVLTYVSHSVEARGKIDDDQVPLGFLELDLEFLVAGELVHAGDQQGIGVEDIEVDVGVDELICQQVEAQAELEEELVLPLLDQAARGDDQALSDVIAQQQLLDVEASHDRLARARVIREEEPQRSPREQLAVDGADLMGQWPYIAGRHSQHRVEQAGECDALGFSNELEV